MLLEEKYLFHTKGTKSRKGMPDPLAKALRHEKLFLAKARKRKNIFFHTKSTKETKHSFKRSSYKEHVRAFAGAFFVELAYGEDAIDIIIHVFLLQVKHIHGQFAGPEFDA